MNMNYYIIVLEIKNTNLGIANYDPISRAFFKLWEICQDFNLIDDKKRTISDGSSC